MNDDFGQAVIVGITGFIDDDVMEKLSQVGFDPVYGARPLKRAIQQHIENTLAQDILQGKFVAGSTIHAYLDKEKIAFK